MCRRSPFAFTCSQAAYIHNYAQRCSPIARAFSIGKSVHGAELWVLELGVSRGQDVPKPRFKYLVRQGPCDIALLSIPCRDQAL